MKSCVWQSVSAFFEALAKSKINLYFWFYMELSTKRLSIKELAEDDRPREKLVTKGRASLSDAELIAIILRLGNKNETALQLAQRLLSENQNSINEVAKMSISELCKYAGIGEVKAVTLSAAFELGRRRKESEATKRVKITSSYVAYQLFNTWLSDLPYEEFRMLILNQANQVIKDEFISRGGITGTVVDVRLLCRRAIEAGACGIILGHNHPSGQVVASDQDRKITKQVKEALKMLDIALLDHLIIGDKTYFSFADANAL